MAVDGRCLWLLMEDVFVAIDGSRLLSFDGRCLCLLMEVVCGC